MENLKKLFGLFFVFFILGCTQQTSIQEFGKTKEFFITAKNWEFVPNTITVDKGDRVVLKVKSIDIDHGLAIPDFNVNLALVPGAEERVEFIADKTGIFTMFCSVYCGTGHSEMQGKIIVN